jgi:hypothetical protein
MKKIVLSFFLIAIIATSLFAKDESVDLASQVAETSLTYNLYRKIDDSFTLIGDGETYIVDNLNPLSGNTMITDFTIRVDSNLNSSRTVSVKVTPESFKTILNGDQIYDSGRTPVINTIINKKTVEAGINKNREVYRFNIFVVGKRNLPAGRYISNVDVEYIIE